MKKFVGLAVSAIAIVGFTSCGGDDGSSGSGDATKVVDALIIHGSPEYCRDRIRQYFDNGVTTSTLAIMPFDPELKHWDAVRSLSPSAHK